MPEPGMNVQSIAGRLKRTEAAAPRLYREFDLLEIPALLRSDTEF